MNPLMRSLARFGQRGINLSRSLSAGLGLVLVTCPAWPLTMTLGDQDFADGATIEMKAFDAASAGEVAPFNGRIGFDPPGPSFSASWIFNYAPGTYSAGSMVFGIYDHDSSASGSQVGSFTVDGVDFTSMLNGLFEAGGGSSDDQYNVYTIDLASVLAQLDDGSVTFSLSLQGPGLIAGGTRESGYNSAGLDFSTLSLVPEPSSLALLSIGLAGLGALTAAGRRRL